MISEVGLILFLCQLVVKTAGTAGLCSVTPYPNGTVSYHLDQSVVPCGSTYAWRINKTVMADEDRYNDSVVQSSDSRNILFRSCQENVSYRRECDSAIIPCPYSCRAAGGNLAQIGKTTLTPSTELPSPKDSPDLGTILGITIPVAVLVGIFFLAWWKLDRLKKCFQDRKAARCRPDDGTTRRFINGEEPPKGISTFP